MKTKKKQNIRRLLPIAAALALCLLIAGCIGQEKKTDTKALREELQSLTIADLESSSVQKLPDSVILNIMTLQLNPAKFEQLKQIQSTLYEEPIKVTNPRIFRANGFSCRFGRQQDFLPTSQALNKIGAVRTNASRLISYDPNPHDIIVEHITQPVSIFYSTRENPVRGLELSTGQLAWQIRAYPSPKLRGVARLNLAPAFYWGIEQNDNTRLLRMRSGTNATVFGASTFSSQLSRGDFLLIAPEEFDPDALSLGNLFFATQNEPQNIILHLIVCLGLKE